MSTDEKILLGFFPVIHHRYLELLQEFENKTVYFFTEELLEKWDRFENVKRDLRWNDLSEIPKIIRDAGLVKEIKPLKFDSLKEIQDFEGRIVMPDEDISFWFAEKYLSDFQNEIEFKEVYLRADFGKVKKKDFVDPDVEITEDEMHKEFMRHAVEISKKSPDWWRQIGSVAVNNGKVVASACNHGLPSNFGTALHGDPRSNFDAGESIEICSCIHSESSVVAQAAKSKEFSLEGADIYVSTFPCPVCAKLLSETGIKRVFYKEGYSLGEGKEVLHAAGISLIKVA